MDEWTIKQVQDRLESAAAVFAQLPAVKPKGFFTVWPEYLHTYGDKIGQKPRMRRPWPTPRQISEADEAMLWLQWLEKDDAQLLWLRANRTPWKAICWKLGVSRATANRRWQYGIAVILWRLNRKQVPRNRSMSYIVQAIS